MSWQLAAFAILALALAAGFAWYERSRPDARTVALVATMAALAALGRIAFAALPNVKPSTDIILITGYVLGGAPGFVVGAVTGLVSNFFFGQGPWTAWQMGAWALTGVVGAGLGRLAGGRIRRWPLALVCLVVGYAFAAIQDVGDWVNYSDHSLGQLGAYVGAGTGFDLIHAGGCLAFALAFGPALIRSLQRFERRHAITWLAPGASVVPSLLLVATVSAGLLAALPAPARSSSTPSGYLLAAQNADGGFGAAPGSPSVSMFSGWAALGLASVGINPADVRHGGASLLANLVAGAVSISDVGSVERTILVVRAAGLNPAAFAGQDLLARLEGRIASDGSVSEQVNLTAFAVLALRASGAPVSGRTVAWLRRQQNGDGGFAFGTAGAASDVDDTGAALEALAGTGGGSQAAIARAVRFLRQAQNGDGGLPEQPGAFSDAQSTAWAVQGLVAVGVDPSAVRRRGRSPGDYLRSLVAGDGHIRYSSASDQTPVWVTAQALMALAGRALPLAPVPLAPRSTAGRSAAPRSPAASRVSASRSRARAPSRPGAGRRAGTAHRPRRPAGAAVSPAVGGSFGLGSVAVEDEASILTTVARVLGSVGFPARVAAGV